MLTLAGEPLWYNNLDAVLNPWFVAHGHGLPDWRQITGAGLDASGANLAPVAHTR